MNTNIRYVSYLVMFFFISCYNNAGNEKASDIKIERQSKNTIDESELVLSTTPFCLKIAEDSLLACIVDSKFLTIYSISTGNLYQNKDIDSILVSFDNIDFIKNYCQGIYNNRKYILDKEEIEGQQMPKFKLINILAPIHTLDSVDILVNVFTPYHQEFTYQGKKTNGIWEDYSLMCVNVNLNKGIVNKTIPIRKELIEKAGTSDSMTKTNINPEYGGCFIFDNKLYTALFPNMDKYKLINEVAIFNLSNPQTASLDNHNYPPEYKLGPGKWFLGMKSFEVEDEGAISCNSLFDIYYIENKKAGFSLRKYFNLAQFEHIHSYHKRKNSFIIQSVIKDSSDNSYFDFRLYDPQIDKLTPSKLRLNTESTSLNSIILNNRIILISKDEEHYYIETYKIVQS